MRCFEFLIRICVVETLDCIPWGAHPFGGEPTTGGLPTWPTGGYCRFVDASTHVASSRRCISPPGAAPAPRPRRLPRLQRGATAPPERTGARRRAAQHGLDRPRRMQEGRAARCTPGAKASGRAVVGWGGRVNIIHRPASSPACSGPRPPEPSAPPPPTGGHVSPGVCTVDEERSL